MKAFRQQSLHRKLMIIVIGAISIAILMMTAAATGFDRFNSTQTLKQELQVLTDLTANRSAAALMFNDKRNLMSNLRALFIRTAVEKACLYNAEHILVAEHIDRSRHSLDCPKTYRAADQRFNLISSESPIEVKGRTIGMLQTYANLNELNLRLLRDLIMLLSIGIVSALAAWLFTLNLQRKMLEPIEELNTIAHSVSRTSDYTMRARRLSDDEIGELVLGFNRLLSSIQQYEREMLELIDELKLTNEQIEQQSQEIDQNNKFLKDFFAGASHDLRQPLQAMTIFISALKQQCEPSQRKLVEKLEQAADNLSELFRSLMDISKLEDNIDNIVTENIAIKPLLDRVFHEFDAIAADKNLQLRFHVGNYQICTNADLLERVVRNLLSNAIRYTERGGILLGCRRRGDHLSIEIWDTGVGIREDFLDKIFGKFVQLQNKNRSLKQGFGLGLAIVKRLCDGLGHPITVNSKINRGSVFRIQVPLINAPNPSLLAALKSPSASDENNALKAMAMAAVVALVDDDKSVRESMTLLLESWQMKVFAMESIEQIRQFCIGTQTEELDLIISDFQISEDDTGLDAIELLHDYFGEDIPALIITGTTDPLLLQQIDDAEINRLSKPVKPAKLRALIQHLLTH